MTLTNNFRHHGYVFKQFGDFQTFFSDGVKFLIFEKNKGHVTRRRKSAFSLNFWNFSFENSNNFFSKFKFNNFLEQILKSADVLTLKIRHQPFTIKLKWFYHKPVFIFSRWSYENNNLKSDNVFFNFKLLFIPLLKETDFWLECSGTNGFWENEKFLYPFLARLVMGVCWIQTNDDIYVYTPMGKC